MTHRISEIDIRIYYEDTDFTGIVYHANYLKYFERGRTEGLRMAGIQHSKFLALSPPLAFSVRHMDINWVAPGTVDDLIRVRTEVIKMKGARIIFDQQIWRDDTMLAQAKVEVACIAISDDGPPRPARIPKEMLAKFED